MISRVYGTLGAATGITQGLIRAAFGSSKDPATSNITADQDSSTTEPLASYADQGTKSGPFLPVTLVPIVVVGHSGAGKTTFLNTYLEKHHSQPTQPTVGADLSIRQICVGQHAALLQIWDTAGEKQAHLLDAHFWGNAAGAIIVCNVAQADSTQTLDFWQQKLCQFAHQGVAHLPVAVVATNHKQAHHSSTENLLCQREGLCIRRWCEDNNIMLFTMTEQQDKATAEMAMQFVTHAAIQSLKQS